MGSSFDRSDSISDDCDEGQDVFVLPEEDISEVENAKELNNIKRILNECRVLYKSKVDHHNRKVFIIFMVSKICFEKIEHRLLTMER